MVPSTPIEIDELESKVEAFESLRLSQGHANIIDYLPASNHARYFEIAAELVRVDMELSWNDGLRNNLDYYCQLIPGLSKDQIALEKVAYEEYRLRIINGETVTPEEYQSRFGFSTTAWKRHHLDSGKSSEIEPSSLSKTLTSAWSNALQLADDFAEFPESNSNFLGFQLDSEIGRGAFAKVYLARQGELADRYVVLKVARGRSLEPQHLARLQHTNIVPIYSVHQVNRLTAVCMPYLGRRTLSDFVKSLSPTEGLPTSGQVFASTLNARDDNTLISQVPVPRSPGAPSTEAGHHRCLAQTDLVSKMSYVEAATRIVVQIAEGLQHAHQRGIVHRDLKLANILLTDDGNALILDFNLSEELVVNGPTALAVGGTLPYMAPEHLTALIQGGSVDARSDIYSLGVIFYELLTGKQPFPIHRGGLESVVNQMVKDRQSPPSNASGNSLSPDHRSILSRCLAPDADQRYQSVAELLEDLRRHLTDLPLRYASNSSLFERAKKWTRRHPRLSSAASVATFAAILLVTLGWVSLRLWANNAFQQFAAELPTARAALSIPENDFALIQDGMITTSAALHSYGVTEDVQWNRPLKLAFLDPAQRLSLQSALSELAYNMAAAELRLAKLTGNEQSTNEAQKWNKLASAFLYGMSKPQALAVQQDEISKMLGKEIDLLEIPGSADKLKAVDPLNDFLVAQQLVFDGQFATALPLISTLRDQKPHDAVVWLLLGDTYAGLRKLDRAEECFSTANALLPVSHLPLHHRGRCRMDLGQFQLAVEDFDAVLQMRANFPPCLLNRALAQAALGNHAAAILDYTTALDHGAPYTRIYFLRARSHESLGNLEAASKDRAKGLSLVPTDEESWIARGMARLSKDPKGALADFREALKMNPTSLSALQNIVYVTADVLEQYPDSLDSLNRILAIDSRNADALAGRAVLFARQGDRARALADVQKLLRVSKQPIHLFQAACSMALTSSVDPADLQKALTLLSNAVLLDPRLMARSKTDKDLEVLRKHPGYENLLKVMATAPKQ